MIRLPLCFCVLFVLFVSCGKKKSNKSQEGGSGAVNVSGQLVVPQGSSAPVPNQLVILPVTSAMGSGGGSLSLMISKQAVNGDGSYSVGLQKASSGQMLAINSGQSSFGVDLLSGGDVQSDTSWVVGGITGGQSTTVDGRYAESESMSFVGLSAGSDNFINFPVSDAATTDMKLGRTTVSGGDAKSEFEVSSSYYNLPDGAIKELAGLSSPLKGAKNTYVNQDGYTTTPYFAWIGSKAAVASSISQNSFSAVDDVIPGTAGFGIYFSSQTNNAPLLKDACGAGFGTIGGYTLQPPEPIKENPRSGDSTPPASMPSITTLDSSNNSGSATASGTPHRFQCAQGGSPKIYIYGYREGATADNVHVSGFNWGGSDGYQSPLPAGKWTLKYNGTTVGLYDLAAAWPVRDGASRVYMPSVKVTASNNVISKVEVRFYLYNKTSKAYDVVTNLQAFRKVVSSLFIDLNIYSTGGNRELHVPISLSSGDSSGVFTVDSSQFNGQTWTESDLTGAGGVLSVGYQMYGYSMRTEYRR